MRPASTIFFPFISLALGIGSLLFAAAPQNTSSASSKRVNELTVAGLRPGQDTLPAALKRFKSSSLAPAGAANAAAKFSDSSAPSGEVKLWRDPCSHQSLQIEADAQGQIQEITVSALPPAGGNVSGKCDPHASSALDAKDWVTGHGLRLGDTVQRVIQLYGKPDTMSPSVKGKNELEFLYYAFDWAGSDVPQVLEIYCARDTGRVLEITLAYPSL